MSKHFRMADERWRDRLPAADPLGHRTRYSDSSSYDDVCVLCGLTDADPMQKQPCPDAVSDEQAGTVTRVAIPVSLPTADAPGQGFGGLSLPDAMDASRAAAGIPGPTDPITQDEKEELSLLRSAAPIGNVAISPFASLSLEYGEMVDIIMRDGNSVVGFRIVAHDVPIDTARYLVALWRADRRTAASAGVSTTGL